MSAVFSSSVAFSLYCPYRMGMPNTSEKAIQSLRMYDLHRYSAATVNTRPDRGIFPLLRPGTCVRNLAGSRGTPYVESRVVRSCTFVIVS